MTSSPDGTVLLYSCGPGQWSADVLCGRCRHGRYLGPKTRDVVRVMAGLWLHDHYIKDHPDWVRAFPEHLEWIGGS